MVKDTDIWGVFEGLGEERQGDFRVEHGPAPAYICLPDSHTANLAKMVDAWSSIFSMSSAVDSVLDSGLNDRPASYTIPDHGYNYLTENKPYSTGLQPLLSSILED